MSSLTSLLWTAVGFKSRAKRATPRVISSIIDNLSSPSVHDRSSYSAPALRSPQLAFESPLFTSHPPRFVSLSELIPGLAPPIEVQLEDLESIEAEGEIVGARSSADDLSKQLCRFLAFSHRPTPRLEPPPSHLSLFVSSLFFRKEEPVPEFWVNVDDYPLCMREKWDAPLGDKEFEQWIFREAARNRAEKRKTEQGRLAAGRGYRCL